MKKLLAVLFVAVFAVTFAIGIVVTTAEAKAPCISTCINHVQVICCPTASGWDCQWGGYCNW